MNIFVTNPDPVKSAQVLPDKHVVKMPLETCQMLAVVFSKWYYNWGNEVLPKKDGTMYQTEKVHFVDTHVQYGQQKVLQTLHG